ncbi:MAG: DUF3883 domain-containing protein, partial [Verrucomicrobia bacterium]|nr:DUF3883 domain-containing protein [Verrucomicrobiota bacterium]
IRSLSRAALESRIRAARERERIGFLGEEFVFSREQDRLKSAGRDDLAGRVRWVALNDSTPGYDLLSFASDGAVRHIEVKATRKTPESDQGFWLSENERKVAEDDESWQVVRVWGVDTTPSCADLGNIVRSDSSRWTLTAGSWFVVPNEVWEMAD